ncbi:MAG: HaeII family restriction endonuclease, partial [Halobacteriovoraceae bacterium]|nr:HaeII family restriction endonuclease [Halobacteriovoraceae bacterium]
MRFSQAKGNLDKVIEKSRVHFYKPIQVAEVLYKARIGLKGLDLQDIESYRTISRKWRDEVSIQIVGRVSTSSARYQDDVWNENAMPPKLLAILGKYNSDNDGIIEAYIYSKIQEKHQDLVNIYNYIKNSSSQTFELKKEDIV